MTLVSALVAFLALGATHCAGGATSLTVSLSHERPAIEQPCAHGLVYVFTKFQAHHAVAWCVLLRQQGLAVNAVGNGIEQQAFMLS